MRHSKAVLGAVVLSALGAPGCGKVMEFVRSLTGGSTDTAAPRATPAQGEAPQAPARGPRRTDQQRAHPGAEPGYGVPGPSRPTRRSCRARCTTARWPPTRRSRSQARRIVSRRHRRTRPRDAHRGALRRRAHRARAECLGAGGRRAHRGGHGDAAHPLRLGQHHAQTRRLAPPLVERGHSQHLAAVVRGDEHAGMHRDNFDGALAVVARDLHLDHVTFRLNRGFGFGLVDGGTLAPTAATSPWKAPSRATPPTAARSTCDARRAWPRCRWGDTRATRWTRCLSRRAARATTWPFAATPPGATWVCPPPRRQRRRSRRGPGWPHPHRRARRDAAYGSQQRLQRGLRRRRGPRDGRPVRGDAHHAQARGQRREPGPVARHLLGPLANRSGSRVRFVNLRAAGATWSTSLCDWAGENGDGSFIYWQAQPGPSAIELRASPWAAPPSPPSVAAGRAPR